MEVARLERLDSTRRSERADEMGLEGNLGLTDGRGHLSGTQASGWGRLSQAGQLVLAASGA